MEADAVSEHHEQATFFQIAGLHLRRYPGLELMHAVPNGGHRFVAVAGKLKLEGVRAGVPDVFLPVPNGRYFGLWLEFKFGRNRPTAEQLYWLHALRFQGYATVVVYSATEAWSTTVQYLERELLELHDLPPNSEG